MAASKSVDRQVGAQLLDVQRWRSAVWVSPSTSEYQDFINDNVQEGHKISRTRIIPFRMFNLFIACEVLVNAKERARQTFDELLWLINDQHLARHDQCQEPCQD